MTESNSAASGKSTAKLVSDLRVLRGTVTTQQKKMRTYVETPGRVMLVPEIETRLGLLDSYMTRFNEYQSRLEVEDPEEQESDKRSSYEEIYVAIKNKLLSLKAEESPRASINGVSSFINSSKPNINLPKINIKSFSGKFPDWADFYATFRTLVEKNDELSDIEKLAYLRGSLDAEPLQVISNISLEESGFNDAITLLKARYENKRLIFQGHIRTLTELKPIDKPSVSKLRSISDQANSHLRALKSMATMEQIAEGLLLNLLGSKVDPATKLKWEEEAPLNILPTLDVFSTFLNRRCQTLENVEFGKRDLIQSSRDEVKASCKGKPLHRSSFSANHAIPTCTSCKGQDHDISSCGFFRKLSPLERYFEAKRLNLCLNCLKVGHATKNCKARRCRYCSYKHHTLLHRHQTQGIIEEPSVANKESTSPRNQDISPISSMISQIGFKDDEEKSFNSLSDPSYVILATALVDIEGSLGTLTPYRALLDSGSSSHFVTERLVQQLRLKRQKVYVNVDGIGPVTIVVKHKVELVIRSRNSDFCTTIEALVLPKISNQQPSRVVDTKAWKIPQNIALADPAFHTPQPIDILLRFRSRRYAITADISKMYRQVRVLHPDTNWQCILWRTSPKAPLEIYRLLTVTYGMASASFLAIACLRQLALDAPATFPLGAEVLKRDFYVDDMLTGAETIEEARTIQHEVDELLRSGGFELAKWCSNSPEILSSFKVTSLEKHIQVFGDNFVKTLGMFWQPQEDIFRFFFQHSESSDATSHVTKRKVLSIISCLFDPLGLVNPIIVRTKIFLQKLWALKLAWDESLTQDLHSNWLLLYSQLSSIEKVSIPRFVLMPSHYIEIHGFADASMSAYGACVYARCTEEQTITCNLLTAKSRVAPLKTISIPRLELCAALLLAELITRVTNIFRPVIRKVYCWSDSTIVLAWLRSSPSKWNTFVGNRVSKIQELTHSITWRHVPTHLNPADLVSRGASPSELVESSLWFSGPDFLHFTEKCWPEVDYQLEDALPEMRRAVAAFSVGAAENIVESSKFCNSFVRLVNLFAYIYRFCTNSRVKSKDSSSVSYGPISADEFERALMSVIRLVQKHYFVEDYGALSSCNCLRTNSVLKTLNAFLDDKGIIRVGGRLHESDLAFDSKHPIILPKSNLSRALVRHYHHKHLHIGCQTLLAIIRTRFWLIGGRNVIKKVIRNCVRCSRLRPKMMEQLMGQLPSPRVQPSPVFCHTGVDFCGPFYIKSPVRNRAPMKSYICLFICLAVKAVHLEVAENLSSESFLSAFTKFKARRPNVSVVYSDNATNFVGGYRELRELNDLFKSEEHSRLVQEMCAKDGITWNFIPPRSPHFGGLWEAAITQAKHHLRKVFGLQPYTMDELQRTVCQIESILNSRPLVPLSDDPNDLEALTPGHFLTGGPMVGIPGPTYHDDDVKYLSRWQKMQGKMQTFWFRWQNEYLQTLQRRIKWKNIVPDLKIGSLVLLKEDGLPPLKWAMGRVVQVHFGKDGHVRVAHVRTINGVLKRTINKICPLPVDG